MLKLALSVLPVPDTKAKVNVSPVSASVAVRVPTVVPEAEFSATAAGVKPILVGAVLNTSVTVAVVVPPVFVAVTV